MTWQPRLDYGTLRSTGEPIVVFGVEEEEGLADVVLQKRILFADPPPPIERRRVPLSDVEFGRDR